MSRASKSKSKNIKRLNESILFEGVQAPNTSQAPTKDCYRKDAGGCLKCSPEECNKKTTPCIYPTDMCKDRPTDDNETKSYGTNDKQGKRIDEDCGCDGGKETSKDSYMASSQLHSISNKAEDMYNKLEKDEVLDDWVESHLAKIDQMMDSVSDSFNHDQYKHAGDMGPGGCPPGHHWCAASDSCRADNTPQTEPLTLMGADVISLDESITGLVSEQTNPDARFIQVSTCWGANTRYRRATVNGGVPQVGQLLDWNFMNRVWFITAVQTTSFGGTVPGFIGDIGLYQGNDCCPHLCGTSAPNITSVWWTSNSNYGMTGPYSVSSNMNVGCSGTGPHCCGTPSYDPVQTSSNQNFTAITPQGTHYCDGATQSIPGCTDPMATNYDPLATIDDGSCDFVVNDDSFRCVDGTCVSCGGPGCPYPTLDDCEKDCDSGVDDPCDKFYTIPQNQQDMCCEKCQANISPSDPCYPYCDCCKRDEPGKQIYCECCDKSGSGISMFQTVSSPADCIGAENTVYAGLGVSRCAVSPVSGGPGTKCKKPLPTDPTNPIGTAMDETIIRIKKELRLLK